MKHRYYRNWLCMLLGCWLVCGVANPVADVQTPDEIRRVVVIHFDTTRVDDWSCYGGVGNTPNVDAVAASGLRYTNAITCVPWTSPSIATFMTGQYPYHHRVHKTGAPLLPWLTTLAEVLKRNGFRTGGFCTNPVLFHRHGVPAGYNQGFEVMGSTRASLTESVTTHISKADCTRATEEALRFVREHREDKFFLWMLHLDPHFPYIPPRPYDRKFLDHPDLAMQNRRFEGGRWGENSVTAGDLIARHKAEVAAVDNSIGLLLAELDSLEGKTLLVITSDHGESFVDDEYWFDHGLNLRYPSLNVPLIIRCEDVVPVGFREALVGNADLAPTILDLLDIDDADFTADGRSLVPTFANEDPWPERLIPIQTDPLSGEVVRRGVRSKHFSFQADYNRTTGAFVSATLFDHREDPSELNNLYDSKPELAARLLGFVRTTYFPPEGVAPGQPIIDDPEMHKRLKSLGYLK